MRCGAIVKIKNKRHNKGFTLMELMITVSVIGILSLIVLPKMNNLLAKSRDAGTKGALLNLRSAIRLYYMDNEQVFPSDLSVIQQSKYWHQSLPFIHTKEHDGSNKVNLTNDISNADTGEWGYVTSGPFTGTLWIQCTHFDTKEHIWSCY